jgi:integrase
MLTIEEQAAIRGWVQGMTWKDISELYFDEASLENSVGIMQGIVKSLADKAKLLGLKEHEKIWREERESSDAWMKKALISVQILQSHPDPKPKPSDSLDLWFPTETAKIFKKLKVVSILDLSRYINARGEGWWKTIPRFGAKTANNIHDFLKRHEPDLSLVLQLDKPEAAPGTELVKRAGVAPLEQMVLPLALTGENGSNRLPAAQCAIDVSNDYEAILAWLNLYDESPQTFRTYRKEAERFFLWCLFQRKKPFSSITVSDCKDYRRFLADPEPREMWISKTPWPRNSTEWRPFKGGLTKASIRQAEIILRGLFQWLVSQLYLRHNPYTAFKRPQRKKVKEVNRFIPLHIWQQITDYADLKANDHNLSPKKRAHYARLQFVLLFGYSTGLRLNEMVNAKTGDLENKGSSKSEQWWLSVIGKGQIQRIVPISPTTLALINAQLKFRGVRPIGSAPDDVHLIGSLRHNLQSGITDSALYQSLKDFFAEVSDFIGESDPSAAEKLKSASTHWLRHTHGTHAVAGGVSLATIQENLGHSSLATTSLYVHTESDKRHKDILEFFEN